MQDSKMEWKKELLLKESYWEAMELPKEEVSVVFKTQSQLTEILTSIYQRLRTVKAQEMV